MTPYHHESRVRLGNGFPCWLGARIALPSVDINIEPPGEAPEGGEPRYSVLIMVGSHRGSSWAIRDNTTLGELGELLADWAAGPEEALKKWFDREPPGPGGERVEIVDEAEASAAAKASGATAEGLGL